MKASFESLTSSVLSSFLVRRFDEKKFSAPYHVHPELELTFILSGNGKRYVGSKMNDFNSGDFVLLGSNLPHCWKTEFNTNVEESSSIVVQFQRDFLGADFFEKPEMMLVSKLLKNSDSGIRFTNDGPLYKNKMLELLEEKNNFKKVILLLDLLHHLSLSKKYELLEKKKNTSLISNEEQQRLHVVMAYIVEYFRENVTLVKAASIANMTPAAFCKYFKRTTRKTFIEAVTDYRVDYAAQQLINTSHAIAQISFDSGFNDLSHFHKTFKGRMQLSPLCYRNIFLQKL